MPRASDKAVLPGGGAGRGIRARPSVPGSDAAIVSRLLGREVSSLEEIRGGRNSRVYRAAAGRETVVAKFYFRHPADPRDRLQTEVSSLRFLWEQGVRDIPHVLASDAKNGCAVFERMEGRPIPAAGIAGSDVDRAVDFLARLRELCGAARLRSLPPASEACFSGAAVVENLRGRLRRISDAPAADAAHREVRRFLREALSPAMDRIADWARSRYVAAGLSFEGELPLDDRTLSPSDFGLHNAVRAPDGRIRFLDFEYFGWDDPVKTVSDFLRHPAMRLRAPLRRRFVSAMLKRFPSPALPPRLKILHPLFGLKWCLIFLNEFVPQDRLRRGFAASSESLAARAPEGQLRKARRLLREIENGYEEFPDGA